MSLKSYPLIFSLLGASLWAQAPQDVTISRVAADDSVLLYWKPIPGATYNVYDANQGYAGSCPAVPAVPDQAGLTQNFYADNPEPGWDSLPLSGNWQTRFWCYWVSSVVNNVESAKAGPFSIAIGESGYMGISFASDGPDPDNPCNSAPFVPLLSTDPADYIFTAFYRDSAGVNHPIPLSVVIIGPYGAATKTFAEVEWKLGIPGSDGTFIPWDPVHAFWGEFEYRPTGLSYFFAWAPDYNRDLSYYNQASIRILVSNPKIKCPMTETNFWQNVTR